MFYLDIYRQIKHGKKTTILDINIYLRNGEADERKQPLQIWGVPAQCLPHESASNILKFPLQVKKKYLVQISINLDIQNLLKEGHDTRYNRSRNVQYQLPCRPPWLHHSSVLPDMDWPHRSSALPDMWEGLGSKHRHIMGVKGLFCFPLYLDTLLSQSVQILI